MRKKYTIVSDFHFSDPTSPGYLMALRIRELEAENAKLGRVLVIAKDSVQWMADATDADPEDFERLALVNDALKRNDDYCAWQLAAQASDIKIREDGE